MRKTFCIILFAVVFTSCSEESMREAGIPGRNTSEVTLAWDPSSSEFVTGYMVYISNANGDYIRNIDVGNHLSYTVRNLEPGTYYFVCTAYDSFGRESDFSNEVHTTINLN